MESNFKSVKDWKKAFPKDYTYAKNKNMLPFIYEKMGWVKINDDLLSVFNEIKETELKEVYNIFLGVEKELNIIKNKNNKASGVRIRQNIRALISKLKTVKKEIN